MDCKATNHWTVLQAIVDLLIDELKYITPEVPDLSETTCFITADAFPPYAAPSDTFLTVFMGGADYDPALFEGGGELQIEEGATVVVAINTTVKTDQAGHDKDKLVETARGMLPIKKKILKILSGRMLIDPSDGEGILRDCITPVSSTSPQGINEQIMQLQIVFSTPFDWDLESDE